MLMMNKPNLLPVGLPLTSVILWKCGGVNCVTDLHVTNIIKRFSHSYSVCFLCEAVAILLWLCGVNCITNLHVTFFRMLKLFSYLQLYVFFVKLPILKTRVGAINLKT